VERSVRSRLIKEILGIYSQSLPKPRGPLCVPPVLPGYGMRIIPARTSRGPWEGEAELGISDERPGTRYKQRARNDAGDDRDAALPQGKWTSGLVGRDPRLRNFISCG